MSANNSFLSQYGLWPICVHWWLQNQVNSKHLILYITESVKKMYSGLPTMHFFIFIYCVLRLSIVLHDPLVKGKVMGPLLILVSPYFRENVIVTCTIVSFLCGLDHLRWRLSSMQKMKKKALLFSSSHFSFYW